MAQSDYSRAYALMARLAMPGEDYLHVLGRIHRHLEPRTYLEIGVARGDSLALVLPSTLAIGIDPQPNLRKAPAAHHRIFAATSDEFFARQDVLEELGGRAIDLAFIDGLHRFEQALRDFINVERLCARSSVILVHDCCPLDARTAQREQVTGFWSGDIWRLLLLLRERRPDLLVHTIAAPPTGLGIVLNPDPDSRALSDQFEELTREYLAKDYAVLEGFKARSLGLVANHWPTVRALIERRGAGRH
ncbi:MAG TPA: class I SAM-dependent methyltransferase [Steroidobacteraceae bacterium]|nr:class I SAM-dependent methyltransferase [Steroidobacteraceae bacterium]